MGHQSMVVEADFVDFLGGLRDILEDVLPNFELRTEHTRNGQIFRGHMKYVGNVWRDWVAINWGDHGILPARIWGFVDLMGLDKEFRVNYGGVGSLAPAVYAIVEAAMYSTDEEAKKMSDIFVPITKRVGRMVNGKVTKLKFYLADVEAFEAPMVVIPDIGGKNNEYFVVKNRDEWREDFEAWLESTEEDSIHPSDDESTDEEDSDDSADEMSLN